jgi:hypothetical protein
MAPSMVPLSKAKSAKRSAPPELSQGIERDESLCVGDLHNPSDGDIEIPGVFSGSGAIRFYLQYIEELAIRPDLTTMPNRSIPMAEFEDPAIFPSFSPNLEQSKERS